MSRTTLQMNGLFFCHELVKYWSKSKLSLGTYGAVTNSHFARSPLYNLKDEWLQLGADSESCILHGIDRLNRRKIVIKKC